MKLKKILMHSQRMKRKFVLLRVNELRGLFQSLTMFNYTLISIFALMGLIIINLIWEIFYHPIREEGSWLVIKSAILLLPLKGIMQKKMYTYRWSGMLIMLFFIEGLVRFYSEAEPSKWFALSEIIFSVIYLLAICMFVKESKKS